MNESDGGYAYPIEQCEVEDKKSLTMFRQMRRKWLDWLKDDEHHAISRSISTIMWNDVAYRTLVFVAESDPKSALNNPLVSELMIHGHFAVQVLAIRRLLDKRVDVISLRRLLDDVKCNVHLFTRENFVAFDGLPYDYEQAQRRVFAQIGGGPFWGAKSGPDAYNTSHRAHEMFDRLTKIDPSNRDRRDQLPLAILENLFGWLKQADDLVEWSHKFLAHAADPKSRQKIELAGTSPSLEALEPILKSLVRILEALGAYLLFDGGQGMIVPIPQFDQFMRLESPVFSTGNKQRLLDEWDALAEGRNNYLEGTLDALVIGTSVH